MPAVSQIRQVEFRSLDGLRLRGALVVPHLFAGPLSSLRFGFRARGAGKGRARTW